MAFVLNEGHVYFRVFVPPCENAALSDVKRVVCSIMQEDLIMVYWTQKNHISSTSTIVCKRMCDNSSLLWPQLHSQIKSSSLRIMICLFLGEKYFFCTDIKCFHQSTQSDECMHTETGCNTPIGPARRKQVNQSSLERMF